MEGKSSVTQSFIDEHHSWDIEGDEMAGESAVTRSVIDQLHSWDTQRDQMDGESGVTRSIIDELQSSDMVKRKVKVVLLEVSLMKFILTIWSKGRLKWCYSKYR